MVCGLVVHESAGLPHSLEIFHMPMLVQGFIFNLGVLCSVGVVALEMYATALVSLLLCFCRRTAPRPYDDTSAETVVSRLGSNAARIGLFVRASLISENALVWDSPQIQ